MHGLLCRIINSLDGHVMATEDVLANKMVLTWLRGHALGGILSVHGIPEQLCTLRNVTRAYNDIGVSSKRVKSQFSV